MHLPSLTLRFPSLRRARRYDLAFFRDCHRRIDALLRPAIEFWKGAVDWDQGGFYGLIDYEGRPRPDADKALIQQVRHLWTFSQIYRSEDASPAIATICDRQFEFVRDHFYSPARSEFHCAVSFNGVPRPGEAHLYFLAFGVLALANYATAFAGKPSGRDALRIARSVFDAMVEKSYDTVDGFDETAYDGRWCTGAKEINTQMHLLEAMTELLAAARAHDDIRSDEIARVLRHQLTLVATKGIVSRDSRHFCSRGYEKDWSVVDVREIDYGHDIEVVYLMMLAASALGLQTMPELVDPVVRLGRSVTDAAYDSSYGKWLYSGDPITGRVIHRESSIWANFEALNGLSTLHQMTGEPEFLDKFEGVLRWLETKQRNPAVGEWYYNVDHRGRPLDTDVFGNDCAWMSFAWKSSYHSLRALLTRKQWLENVCSTLGDSRETAEHS
jgi:mannobiose 2-epimerase